MKGKALVKPETLSVEPVDTQTKGKSQNSTEAKMEPSSSQWETATPRPSTHESSRSLHICAKYIMVRCTQQCWLRQCSFREHTVLQW